GAEARAVAQGRMAERRVEQVVQVLEPRRHRTLCPLVDQPLEESLFLVRIAQLSRRVAELRLDDAVEPAREGAKLRASRASRPDSLRHGRARGWSGSRPEVGGRRDG